MNCELCNRPLAENDVQYLTDPAVCGRSVLDGPLDDGLAAAIVEDCAEAAQ